MLEPLGFNSLSNNSDFLETEAGQSLQKNPLGFIDIGARWGAHELVNPIASLSAILGFEPDKLECERMMQTPEIYKHWAAFNLEPIALANTKSKADLYLLACPSNNSLLPPNTEYHQRYSMDMKRWKLMGQEHVHTELLDTVLFSKSSKYSWGEVIKLDVQGAEHEILQGSTRTLSERTVAIVTEVSFCELYKGQKLFSDIDIFLRQNGFSFYGFTKVHGRSCRLLDKKTQITAERPFYADAVFFKDPLPGASNRKLLDDRGNYVLFTAALLLGYYDFALELASKTWAKSEKSIARVKKLILQLSNLSAANTHQAITELVKSVDKQPDLANIMVGGFANKYHRCNYDDVKR